MAHSGVSGPPGPGFGALFENADPNIPILKQAKAEYAKLQ